MKSLLAAAALTLAGAPALAQGPAPSPAVTTAQPATPSAPAGKLTTESPIEALMARPDAKAALLKTFPKLDENPAYDQFKAMSLRQIGQAMPSAVPAEKLDQVDKDLAALN